MKLTYSLLPLAVVSLAQDQLVDQSPLTEALAGHHVIETENTPAVQPLTIGGIPLIGFGTWRLTNNTAEHVSHAIQVGYTHIDCAAAYGNEEEVGKGIADGLSKTGKKRQDLWITSKLWNDQHSPDVVGDALQTSLNKLGLEYLDLYLMHWPVANDNVLGLNVINYLDAWDAMGKLVDSGKVNHIGVANFNKHQMKQLIKHGKHYPQVHQMELHPYLQQKDFVKWHAKHGIHVTAYSPLAGTNPIYTPGEPTPLLNNTVVKEIGDKRDCTPAQVAIMWAMARGTSVIPKSGHDSRITENFYSLECVLHGSDLKKIKDLGHEHYRFNNPSKGWKVPLYEGLEDWQGKHKKNK